MASKSDLQLVSVMGENYHIPHERIWFDHGLSFNHRNRHVQVMLVANFVDNTRTSMEIALWFDRDGEDDFDISLEGTLNSVPDNVVMPLSAIFDEERLKLAIANYVETNCQLKFYLHKTDISIELEIDGKEFTANLPIKHDGKSFDLEWLSSYFKADYQDFLDTHRDSASELPE